MDKQRLIGKRVNVELGDQQKVDGGSPSYDI